ncbi:Gfo/Idh/MocA family protein [Rhodospirillaceae bacterium SYSU D60014]|uniref:Gfo/Idh/MocA family protein n=1 Tax=Virgifigura deserti TaxID=2268457 RepID=UPI000E675F72
MTNLLRTAVVGVGHFGQFHAEKFARLPGSRLVAVADIDESRARAIAEQYSAMAVTDYRRLIGAVDAVSIATPPAAHYEIAKTFLENGVHVLVEKPITDELDQASALIQIAKDRGCVLQVGHLERFSSVGRVMQELVSNPVYVEAQRIGPFKPRAAGVNAVLDLMIHDLDLILAVVDAPIEWVHAVGAPVLSAAEDIASSRIQFANGCVANVTTSRVSLRSERRMRIFQRDSYMTIDFLKRNIKIVRKSSGSGALPAVADLQIEETNYGDVDALEQEISAFLNAIATGESPLVSGEDGWRALEAALMITRSLKTYWQTILDQGSDEDSIVNRRPASSLMSR